MNSELETRSLELVSQNLMNKQQRARILPQKLWHN